MENRFNIQLHKSQSADNILKSIPRVREVHKTREIVYGYEALLEFKQRVLAGEVQVGVFIDLGRPKREKYNGEGEWHEERHRIYSDGMKQIAQLIESGKLPAHTEVLLYISNHANQDFQYISNALKTGNCPAYFKMKITFDTTCAIQEDRRGRRIMNKYAAEDFKNNWVPQLVSALVSGQCPIGLDIQFCHPLSNILKKQINAAQKTYAKLVAQQQALVLVQGAKQDALAMLPKDILNLICYFIIQPEESATTFSFVQSCRNKLTEISAICFLESYWSLFPSIPAKIFVERLEQIKTSSLPVSKKADEIKCVTTQFLETNLLGHDSIEYKKSNSVFTARKFHLVDANHIVENPAEPKMFKLAIQFSLWKNNQVTEKNSTKNKEAQLSSEQNEKLTLK